MRIFEKFCISKCEYDIVTKKVLIFEFFVDVCMCFYCVSVVLLWIQVAYGLVSGSCFDVLNVSEVMFVNL